MPHSTVNITSDNLFREINGAFQKTYRDIIGRSSNLASCMRLGVPSNKRKEYFGYLESPPKLSRLDRGESVSEDAFKAISYNVENLTWAASIAYYEEDLEDINLLDVRAHAGKLAARARAHSEQVFFQIITGSSDASLLRSIPTAPDGAALFATTAGGSNRFGVSSGNLISGGGVSTSALVRTDFWNAVQQGMQFQDTEGEPLLSEGVIDSGVTVIFNAANLEVFLEAFKQTRTLNSAAVTNTVLEGYGGSVKLWPTARITDNDWFVFFGSDSIQRPVFETVRQAPRLIEEDRANSERARRQRIFSTILDMRSGYGVNLPYGAIKLNN